MNILLTGATGFIGSSIRQELARDHMVNAVARHIPGDAEEGVRWIEADLAAPQRLAASLPESTDAVIHLAQSKGYRNFPAEAGDIFDVNVSSTLGLLEYARKSGAKTFIFASTASLYRQSGELLREDAAVEPASFYARSKRMAEMLVESYAPYFRCIILRIFTVYGPGQKGMLIPNLIEKVRTGGPIQIQGNDGLMLSPIHVRDVCTVVRGCIGDKSPGLDIINVGGKEPLSLRAMGEMIGHAVGVPEQFEFIPGAEPGGWTADIARLGSLIDTEQFTPFETGVKETASR